MCNSMHARRCPALVHVLLTLELQYNLLVPLMLPAHTCLAVHSRVMPLQLTCEFELDVASPSPLG